MKELLEKIDRELGLTSLDEDWKRGVASAAIAGALFAGSVQAAPVPLSAKEDTEAIQAVVKSEVKSKFNLERLVFAILQKESGVYRNVTPRYEPDFAVRYHKNYVANGLYKKYLSLIEQDYQRQFNEGWAEKAKKHFYSSWGPYQIMLSVAWEKGFRGSGSQLAERATNREVFSKFVNDIGSRTNTVSEFGKRYNGSAQYGTDLAKIYKDGG